MSVCKHTWKHLRMQKRFIVWHRMCATELQPNFRDDIGKFYEAAWASAMNKNKHNNNETNLWVVQVPKIQRILSKIDFITIAATAAAAIPPQSIHVNTCNNNNPTHLSIERATSNRSNENIIDCVNAYGINGDHFKSNLK